MGKTMRAIGLMSGTSMDGIDVALIETDGAQKLQRGPAGSYPYSEAFRVQLRVGLAEAAGVLQRDARPGNLRLVEQYLTDLHAEAVTQFLQDHRIAPESIDIVGFHGHTMLHAPERKLTVQIGDGAALARAIGINVVYDLRAADVAAGGQGAPLASIYHKALVAKLARPVAVVNVGGVANVTWLCGGSLTEDALVAFDTGPGNALIDDWMQKRTGRSFDTNGECAGAGRVDEAALAELLTNRFFAMAAPKSLDRDAFSADAVSHLSTEDGAATLTAFTAGAIATSRFHMLEQPKTWIISGGGRKNKTLMSMIAERVENAVIPAEAIALDGDAVEAEAWAYLAVRSMRGWAITFPGTTGVSAPLTGGVLARK
jgi:anhydro-N-acetylmuramic acid kinase